MKFCTTCGAQWGVAETHCPDDGTALVVGEAASTGPRPSSSSRSGPQLAVAESAVESTDELAIGTRVGEYVIERKIGVGGMGVVYGARHPVIGKRAAIKVLNSKLSVDQEALSRFVLEAQSVNKIGHANIVDIFSFGALDDGRSYFVMEWLQGETLGERLDRGRLSIRESITIVSALCRALEAAHAAGVIHRDLKPDNVFLAIDDDGWRVKLLDFGIAKLSTATTSISRTATGVVVGTPLFMAPEQAKGESVDGRTDVYALGLLAYTAVCGHSLFESEGSAIEILAAHISQTPPSPRDFVPDIPAALEKLILEMIAKQPGFRPTLVEIRQTLSAIAAAMPDPTKASQLPASRVTVRASSEPAMAAPALTPFPAAADDVEDVVPARRRRWPLAVIAVATIAGGVAIIVAISHSGEPAPPPPAPAPRIDVAAAPPPVSIDASVEVVMPDPPTVVTPAPAPAATSFVVEPQTARVVVDGQRATIVAGRATIVLAPGDHVAIATVGGRSTRKRFVVTAEQSSTVSLVVPPPPASIDKPVHPPTPTGDDVDGVQDPFHK